MKTIIYSEPQIALANQKLKQWQDNIDFIEARIRIQNQEGFNRWDTPSGASMRTYAQLDIEVFQEKIDLVSANLRATYKAKDIILDFSKLANTISTPKL